MPVTRTILLQSYTMLAKTMTDSPNPWSASRFAVKVMGGSLCRLTVSLNDRKTPDLEYYGGTISIQTLMEFSESVCKKLDTKDPFTVSVAQGRWSKALNRMVTTTLRVGRTDNGTCYLSLSVDTECVEVLFSYRPIADTEYTIDDNVIDPKRASTIACRTYWKRLPNALTAASVSMLTLDAGSFGSELDGGAEPQQGNGGVPDVEDMPF